MASVVIGGGNFDIGNRYLDMQHRALQDILAGQQLANQQFNANRDYALRERQMNMQANASRNAAVPGAARMAAQRQAQAAQDMAMNQWAAERQDKNAYQQAQMAQRQREFEREAELKGMGLANETANRNAQMQLQRDQMAQRGEMFGVEQSAAQAALASREAEAARNRETDNLRWNADRESREQIAGDNRGFQEWQKKLALHQTLSADIDRKYAPVMGLPGPEGDAARAAYAQEKAEAAALLQNEQKNVVNDQLFGEEMAMGMQNSEKGPMGPVASDAVAPRGNPPPVRDALSRALQAETERKREREGANDTLAMNARVDATVKSKLAGDPDATSFENWARETFGKNEKELDIALAAHPTLRQARSDERKLLALPPEQRVQEVAARIAALDNPTLAEGWAKQGVDTAEVKRRLLSMVQAGGRMGNEAAPPAKTFKDPKVREMPWYKKAKIPNLESTGESIPNALYEGYKTLNRTVAKNPLHYLLGI